MSRAAGKDPPSSIAPRGAPPGPRVERDGADVELVLAIGKDGLGIELGRPARLACLNVSELVVRLPHARFPFDVSGGVARFRHRRGQLERVAVEIDALRAARWAEPRLRGSIGAGPCSVTVAPRAFGATITLASSDPKRAPAALAFELALVDGPELAIVVHTARGANLPMPATLLAMRAAAALLGDAARREGSRFVVPRAAERLARALLPEAGVRAPAGADVVLVGSGESDGVLFLAFARGGAAPAMPPAATLANEAALLSRAADDARFAGDLERARSLDLVALERAPRHPQIARRIAEIDAHVGGRTDAAIATLRAADPVALGYLGSLLGDLLVEVGDLPSAIAALLKEGERDPSPAIAALAYARAAALSADAADALTWLDAAVARAPTLAELRWERAERRLTHGRLADARADFQELEAIATGSLDRHHVLRRAADIHRARGLDADAALLYERALLYQPDDPRAVAGLGVTIASSGRAARGATLLARAIELASTRTAPLPTAWMELELARVLGDLLGDRPAAVAHLRAIPDDAREALEARGLEGRYRAAIGDLAGASLAFARLRERAGRDTAAIAWLEEAARFEEGRGELALAQAHLARALALQPTSVTVGARYRAVSKRLGQAAGVRPPSSIGDAKSFPTAESDAGDQVVGPTATEPDLQAHTRKTVAAPSASALPSEDETTHGGTDDVS